VKKRKTMGGGKQHRRRGERGTCFDYDEGGKGALNKRGCILLLGRTHMTLEKSFFEAIYKRGGGHA